MIIKMDKELYLSMDDKELPFACFEPLIPSIRGKGLEVKEMVYSRLTEGQKALFLFNAYFNHASKSLSEFYWWSAYYFAQPRAWGGLLFSLRYFKADDMLQLLDIIDKNLVLRNYPKSLENFNVSYNDINHNQDLMDEFTSLYLRFNHLTPATLTAIGETIRNNPDEFIELNKEKSDD